MQYMSSEWPGTDDPDILELFEKRTEFAHQLMENKCIKKSDVPAGAEAAFTLKFRVGKTEFNFPSTELLNENKKTIRIKGRVVGEVAWENGKLLVKCRKNVDLSIDGDVDCQEIDLQTSGKVTLNSNTNPRQKLKIKADEVVINNPISMVKSIQLDSNKVSLNATVVAGHTTINAKQFDIAQNKKLISPIVTIKTEEMQNDGAIKSKLVCNIETNTLHNKGSVTTGLLQINASEKLLNDGKLYGAYAAEIRGGEVTNKNSIRSKSHIDINSKTYVNAQNADLVAKNMLLLNADIIVAKGDVKSKVISTSSNRLVLHTQLQGRKLDIETGHLALQNVNLELPERTVEELQDESLAGAHSLIVRNGMIVAKGSSLQLKQAVTDIQGESDIQGDLCSDYSKLTIQKARIAGKVAINHTDLEINNTTVNKQGSFNAENTQWQAGSIDSCGKMSLQSCQIKCNGIDISDGAATFNLSAVDVMQDINLGLNGNLSLLNTKLNANVLHSSGQLNSVKSQLIAAGLDQQAGAITLNESVHKLTKGMKQQKGAQIALDQSLLIAPMLMASGNLTSTQSAIEGQRAQINGKATLRQTEIKFSEQFVVGEEGNLNAKDVKMDLNLCQWRGATDIENAEINAQRSAGKGLMRIRKSRLAINDEFRTSSRNNLILDETQLQSEKSVFTGRVFSDRSRIASMFYQQHGEAAYNHSAIQAKNGIEISKEAQLAFKNSHMQSDGDLVVGCNTTLKKSEVSVKNYYQDDGNLQASSSKITVEDNMHLDNGTVSELQQVDLTTSKLGVWGALTAVNTEMKTDVAAFYDKAAIKQSIIRNKGRLLAGQKAKLELSLKSLMQSGDGDIQGNVDVTDGSMIDVVNQLDLRVQSQLNVNSQSAIRSSRLVDYGDAKFDSSLLQVTDLEVASTMSLQNGTTAQVEHLDSQFASTLSVSKSAYSGETATIAGKMNIKKSAAEFKGDVVTKATSEVTLEKAKIASRNLEHNGKIIAKTARKNNDKPIIKPAIHVAEKITTATLSVITGDAIGVKSKDLDHYGSIEKMQDVAIDVDNLDIYGDVHGDTLQVTADNSLFNQGKITGENITLDGDTLTNNGLIKAGKSLTATGLAFTNYSGGVVYAPNANISAGIYANVGGVVSAFNLNKNTIVDLNFGLECPSLPSSVDDVLSPAKLFNVAKMAVTSVSSTLGSVMGIANSLYHLPGQIQDIYTKGKAMHEAGLDKFRVRHAIPLAMSVKNIAVSAVNSGKEIYKIGGETYSFVKNAEYKNISAAGIKEGFSSKITRDNMTTLGKDAFGIFMPMHNTESVFSLNGGIQASYNVTKTDFMGANLGLEYGYNKIVHTSYYQYNAGVTYAGAVSLSAEHFRSDGMTHGRNGLHFEFGDAVIGQNGALTANGKINGTVERDLKIEGEVNLNNDSKDLGKIDIKGKLIVDAKGKEVKFSGIQTTAAEAQLQSNLSLASNATLDAKHTHIHRDVTFDVDSSSKHFAETTTNEGVNRNAGLMAGVVKDAKGKITQVTTMQSYQNEDGATCELTGQAKVAEFHNQGDLNIGGHAEASLAKLTQYGNAHALVSGQAQLLAQQVDTENKIELRDTSKYVVEKTTLHNGGILESHAQTEIIGAEMKIESGAKAKIGGQAYGIEFDQNSQRFEKGRMSEIHVEKEGLLEISGNVKTQQLIDEGKTVLKNNDETGEGGYLHATQAEVKQAASLEQKGKSHFNSMHTEIAGKATVKDNAVFNVMHTDVKQGQFYSGENTSVLGEAIQVERGGEIGLDGLVAQWHLDSEGAVQYQRMGKIQLAEGSTASFRGEAYVRELDNAGISTVTKSDDNAKSGKMDVESFHQRKTGGFSVNGRGEFTAIDANIEGKVETGGSAVMHLSEYSIAKGGQLDLLDQSSLTAQHATVEGAQNISGGSEAMVDETVVKEGGAVIIDKDSGLYGKKLAIEKQATVKNAGEIGQKIINADGTSVCVKMDQIDILQMGDLDNTGVVRAALVKNAGKLAGHQDAQSTDTAKFYLDEYVAEEGGATSLDQKTLFKAAKATLKHKIAATNGSTYAVEQTTVEDKGGVTIDKDSEHLGSHLKVKSGGHYTNQGLAANVSKADDGTYRYTPMKRIEIDEKAFVAFDGILHADYLRDDSGTTRPSVKWSVAEYIPKVDPVAQEQSARTAQALVEKELQNEKEARERAVKQQTDRKAAELKAQSAQKQNEYDQQKAELERRVQAAASAPPPPPPPQPAPPEPPKKPRKKRGLEGAFNKAMKAFNKQLDHWKKSLASFEQECRQNMAEWEKNVRRELAEAEKNVRRELSDFERNVSRELANFEENARNELANFEKSTRDGLEKFDRARVKGMNKLGDHIAAGATNLSKFASGEHKLSPAAIEKAFDKAGKDTSNEWKSLPPDVQKAIIVAACIAVGYGACYLALNAGCSVAFGVATNVGGQTVVVNVLTYSVAGGIQVLPALAAVGAGCEAANRFNEAQKSPVKDIVDKAYENRQYEDKPAPKSNNQPAENTKKPAAPQSGNKQDPKKPAEPGNQQAPQRNETNIPKDEKSTEQDDKAAVEGAKKTAADVGEAVAKDVKSSNEKKADHIEKNRVKDQRAASKEAKAEAESKGEKHTNKQDKAVRKEAKQDNKAAVSSAKNTANTADKVAKGLNTYSKINGMMNAPVDTVVTTALTDGAKAVGDKIMQKAAENGLNSAGSKALHYLGAGMKWGGGNPAAIVTGVIFGADDANIGADYSHLNKEAQRRMDTEREKHPDSYKEMPEAVHFHQKYNEVCQEQIRNEQMRQQYQEEAKQRFWQPTAEKLKSEEQRRNEADKPTIGMPTGPVTPIKN